MRWRRPWGARHADQFRELYLALKQELVDGQENPLPTIQSAKIYEVQKYLILTAHIITPRFVVVNEHLAWPLDADRTIIRRRWPRPSRTRMPRIIKAGGGGWSILSPSGDDRHHAQLSPRCDAVIKACAEIRSALGFQFVCSRFA